MTHQQILDKLAAKHLTLSIDEDISRLVIDTTYPYNAKLDKVTLTSNLLTKLLLRWNCVLKADKKEVSDLYKQKTILAIAVVLHKYGFAEQKISTEAIKAIDALNKEVALSDDFFRKSNDIKKLISTVPVPLKRRPVLPDSVTFYRPKDVISIQLEDKYYAAYIHYLGGTNASPVIEFYNAVFDTAPSIDDLINAPAKGEMYNDGLERVAKFGVSGIKYLPDLSNQIKLIKACVEEIPDNSNLTASVGLYSVVDIFDLQHIISNRLFKQK